MVCEANPLDKILKFLKTYVNIDGYLDKITLVLRGARAQKNAIFGQHFPQSAENVFFGLFFQKYACGAKSSA